MAADWPSVAGRLMISSRSDGTIAKHWVGETCCLCAAREMGTHVCYEVLDYDMLPQVGLFEAGIDNVRICTILHYRKNLLEVATQ